MNAIANPHLSTLSRSTLTRATSTGFQELQDDARATLQRCDNMSDQHGYVDVPGERTVRVLRGLLP